MLPNCVSGKIVKYSNSSGSSKSHHLAAFILCTPRCITSYLPHRPLHPQPTPQSTPHPQLPPSHVSSCAFSSPPPSPQPLCKSGTQRPVSLGSSKIQRKVQHVYLAFFTQVLCSPVGCPHPGPARLPALEVNKQPPLGLHLAPPQTPPPALVPRSLQHLQRQRCHLRPRCRSLCQKHWPSSQSNSEVAESCRADCLGEDFGELRDCL